MKNIADFKKIYSPGSEGCRNPADNVVSDNCPAASVIPDEIIEETAGIGLNVSNACSKNGKVKAVALRADKVSGSCSRVKRNCMMLVIMIVLGFVLAGVLVSSSGLSFSGKVKKAVEVLAAGAVNEAYGNSKISWKIPQEVGRDVKDVNRGKSFPVNPARLVVRGIIFSNRNKAAIVGNQIVSVGDHVLGVRIAEISRREVVFEKDGKKWSQYVEK